MKKKHFRDYATEAFRFWARHGLLDKYDHAEAYKQALWDEEIEAQHKAEGRGGIGNPSEAAIVRAELRLEQEAAQISDLQAVDMTMAMLKNHPSAPCISKVLQMVYMERPAEEIRRGEIQARVLHAADTLGVGESTIYMWLAHCRYVFAHERGLRI